MSFNKKFFATGGIVASSDAVCTTETTDKFGDGNGVALYSLDFDASTAQDAATDYSGTPTDVTFGVGGQIKFGARFNGTSSTIDTGYTPPTGSGNFSVSCWLKLNELAGIARGIWSTTTNSGNDRKGLGLSVSATNVINIRVFDSAGVDNFNGPTLDLNTWYNVVITYDGGLTRMYVNGNLQTGSVNQSITSHHTSLHLGNYYASLDNANMFKGDLDQVRIFESVLSQTQVDTLYDEEACVHTATANTADFPSTATAVAHYPLDNNSLDNKGTNDGTDTNIEYRFGRFGQAAVFNGSSSKITIPAITASNLRSVSFWFKSTQNLANISLFTMGNSNTYSWLFIQLDSGQISAAYSADNGGILQGSGVKTNSTFNDGNWHHVVCVFTGTLSTNQAPNIYVDNVDVATTLQNPTNLNAATASGVGNIGSYSGSAASQFYNGDLDQVRIFSTALDSDQVSQLYNEKPETDTSDFKTVLYEGTGLTQYISNIGYDLDVDNGGDGGLVWIKNRDDVYSHQLYDTVRGAQKKLLADDTNAQSNDNNALSSFEKNGFFVGTNVGVNGNNNKHVAWVWKGGGDKVSNTNGTGITSNVSASDKGFSIVNWSATTTTTDTVGHGLNIDGVATKPELMIMKNASSNLTNWFVYTDLIDGSMDFLYLNDDAAKANSSLSVPNTTTFQQGNLGGVSAGNNCIAYCFASSEYSKIGIYTGNKPHVVTETLGFEPNWIIIKNITNNGRSWVIYDRKRSPTGDLDEFLFADTNAIEGVTGGNWIRTTPTGFQTNGSGGSISNETGSKFLYMAFK